MSKGRKRSRPKRARKIVAKGTPARWEVAWHPKALNEKNEIEDVAERVAIAHVIEKLEVDGPALQSPHQSGVMGEEGSGLRELRPRRGRSRWRPLYRRVDEPLFAILAVGPEAEIDKAGYSFAILAVGPEAEIDKAGYSKAVRLAKQRLKRLGKIQGEGVAWMTITSLLSTTSRIHHG